MSARIASFAALALVLAASPGGAQDRSTVFVHGFKSSGATWEIAANRLQVQLAVTAHRPDLSWRERFETQAGELQAKAPAGHAPLAIAHSNGGLAAREWSKSRALSGLVTLSSPNQGAPIANNGLRYAYYNADMVKVLFDIDRAFLDPREGSPWVYHVIQGAMQFASQAYGDAVAALAVTAFDLWAPVHTQDRLESDFLRDLNGGANLAREASAIPRRTAIVTWVPDFHLGGPIRAIKPELVPYYRYGLYVAIGTLDSWALYLAGTGSYRDQERAQTLLTLSFYLSLHEIFWCQAVSDPTPYAVTLAGRCHPNDSFLPSWSHVWPGSLSVPIANTPEHLRQTESMTPVLYEVLTSHMGVAPRGPTGGPVGPSVLFPGEDLRPGARLTSPDQRYALVYQHDGNLVVYRRDNTTVWASGTFGTSPGVVRMQTDGNFVMYDATGQPVWHTHTYGNDGAYLSLLNNGSVIVESAAQQRLWGTPHDAQAAVPDGGGTGSGGGGGGGGTGPDTLMAGARLYPGQAITSGDGRFALTYQTDGNLVLYAPEGPRWASNTFGSPGVAEMQGDGNFVVYAGSGTPVWASQTAGHVNARLVLHGDGNAVIYTSIGSPIWATNTGGS